MIAFSIRLIELECALISLNSNRCMHCFGLILTDFNLDWLKDEECLSGSV